MRDPSEVIHLRNDIAGVGKRGDLIVIMPDHPDPAFRLTRVVPLPPSMLSAIRTHTPAPEKKRRRGKARAHLQLV